MGKVVVKYESAIKEVDVRLAVSGGDAGRGPKQQKTEITIYTIRNGVVSLLCSLCAVPHPVACLQTWGMPWQTASCLPMLSL